MSLTFSLVSLPEVVISTLGISLIVEFCATPFGETECLSFAEDLKVLSIDNPF